MSGFCLVAVVLVFVRHRTNIGRLLHGRENRFDDSAQLFCLGKLLHVLAVGLWFGTVVFFTFIVGLTLFHTFEGFVIWIVSLVILAAFHQSVNAIYKVVHAKR